MRRKINICSVSGGKDSTALYLLMMEFHGNNFFPVFADTGHEHPVTINYVKNLHHMTGGPEVHFVEADFGPQLTRKGFNKTEYTFLDMMLWKGRAPSTKAQFCTEHLKLWPILFYLEKQFSRDDIYEPCEWVMHTGIRAGESLRRSKMQPFSWNSFFDCESVLPMLYNSDEEQFSIMEKRGIPPNPLYALGYGRVGCFPCIHANKKELSLLPEWAWERLDYYEKTLGRSFFAPGTVPFTHLPTVREVEQWSKTSRGGVQYDMFRLAADDAPSCMTGWISCE